MHPVHGRRPRGVPATLFLALLTGLVGSALTPTAARAAGGAQVLYSTGFEVEEGYSQADQLLPLTGQMGWISYGSGGSGLVTNFFEGFGQQAFIGFAPPAPKDEMFNLWRPVNVTNVPPDRPVISFSVWMQIVDSTNGQYDDFRWSAYNQDGARLFSLDFDNSTENINYVLDDARGFQFTGYQFNSEAIYQLVIQMNFARNVWIASLNGVIVVESQPITTLATTRLNLGDIDAVWAIRRKGLPGDNYLLFDEYILTAEPYSSIPPLLESVGPLQNGDFQLRLHGEQGLSYVVEVTTDFQTWEPLATNRVDTGVMDFVDPTARDYPLSFYRARSTGP